MQSYIYLIKKICYGLGQFNVHNKILTNQINQLLSHIFD